MLKFPSLPERKSFSNVSATLWKLIFPPLLLAPVDPPIVLNSSSGD